MENIFDVQDFIRKFGKASGRNVIHTLVTETPGIMSQCFFMDLTSELLTYELELDGWRPLKGVYIRGSLDNLTIAFITPWVDGTVKLDIYYRKDKADTINLDKLKTSVFFKSSLRLETTSELARLGSESNYKDLSKEDWKVQTKPIFNLKTRNEYLFINVGLNNTYGQSRINDEGNEELVNFGGFPVSLYGLGDSIDERWVVDVIYQGFDLDPDVFDGITMGMRPIGNYGIFLRRFWRNNEEAIDSYPIEIIEDIAKRFLERDPDIEFIGVNIEGTKHKLQLGVMEYDKEEKVAKLKIPETHTNIFEQFINSLFGRK